MEREVRMSNQKTDDFTFSIIALYNLMRAKGHWMESGTIELDDFTRFSYKIQQLKQKKKSSSLNQQKGM